MPLAGRIGGLAQRFDVVHDPERAAVRGDREIVAVHGEVANRGDRQIELQRLPRRAVVKRNVDAPFGAGIEHPAAPRILANGVDERALRNAADDEAPRCTAVVRLIDIRRVIVEAVPVDRRIRRLRIEVRSLDNSDFAPRRQCLGRYVLPGARVVTRHPNITVVGARPYQRGAQRRRRDRIDDAMTVQAVVVGQRRRIEICRRSFIGDARDRG